MTINTLSCNFFDQNGGSFELLIDDVLLTDQANYEDSLIPFWIIDEGIPTFPPHQKAEQISERIVAVCGCGEYGCDCMTCTVEIQNDFVIFKDFRRPGFASVINKTFKFAKENFREVENQLTAESKKIKESLENRK